MVKDWIANAYQGRELTVWLQLEVQARVNAAELLTPRRRPSESRPFRDEPPAFLCAMVFRL